jgi:hypothetical protein
MKYRTTLDDWQQQCLKKTFYISAADFSVQKQEITQTAEGRMIQVNYSNMMKYKTLRMLLLSIRPKENQ